MIVVHVDRGLNRPYARAYYDLVDFRNRVPHVESEYACGRYPANYPMPTINGPTYIGKYGIYQSFADLECYEPQHTWIK